MSKNKTNVLILSKDGPTAGAGKALFRIHSELRKRNNFSSKFLALEGNANPDLGFYVNHNFLANKVYRRIINVLNGWIRRFFGPKPGFVFSHNLFPNLSLYSERLIKEADVIFLGWIGFGYVSPRQFKLFSKKKIIWRLSDSWAFTGGCHIPFGCQNFKSGCNTCPQLHERSIGLAHLIWKLKKRSYVGKNIRFIAPSRWMQEQAKSSPLLNGSVVDRIPTGVDLEVFKLLDKQACKKSLGIDANSISLLFGTMSATEKNKGLTHLIKALKIVQDSGTRFQLVVFGNAPDGVLDGIQLKCIEVGVIKQDEKLAVAYNAADIFLAPYIDDNLPNTVIEAIACGLPVVGFRSGGLPDLIQHEFNGYLSAAQDPTDFANGIKWVAKHLNEISFATNSRQMSQNFSLTTQVDLIENVLNQSLENRLQ